MREFIITAEGQKKLNKKLLRRLLAFFSIMTFMILVVFMYLAKTSETAPYSVVVVLAIIAFNIFTTLRKQKKRFESYRLIVTDDAIVREMGSTPSITIRRSEVKEILKSDTGELTIKGTNALNHIGVPAEVNDIVLLESELNNIRPILYKTSPVWIFLLPGLAIVPIVFLIFLAMASDDPFISLIGGFALFSILISGFVVIQFSKNFDRQVKRMSYIFLIPAFFVIVLCIMKMLG